MSHHVTDVNDLKKHDEIQIGQGYSFRISVEKSFMITQTPFLTCNIYKQYL